MKLRYKTMVLFILILMLFAGGMLMLSYNPHHNSYKLVRAINSNNIEQVNEIIKKHPSSVNTLPSIMPRWWNVLLDNRNFFPLQEACHKGNINIAKLLIEAGADVNSVDPYIGSNPLLMSLASTSENRFDIAFLLIEHGADINSNRRDRQGDSVISESVIIKNTDSEIARQRGYQLFDYLFANCQLTGIDWVPIFMDSSYFENINVARTLLDSGVVNINTINSSGQTALVKAVLAKSKDMVSFLVEKGADKSIKDNDGKTAYDYAIENGNKDILELLKN